MQQTIKDSSRTPQPTAGATYTGWQKLVARYAKPDVNQARWQVLNSFGGLLLGWIALYLSLQVGYWLTLLLAFPVAGFLVRIFIIQHDCGHNSFLPSRRANDLLGSICGVFTMVPYKHWRKSHAIHHAHHAELEERGIGDVWTLTVDEYVQAPWWKRLTYRIFRHPLFLFGVAPAFHFMVQQRFPLSAPEQNRHGETASVWWTNVALVSLLTVASLLLGLKTVIAIQLPVTIIASTVGVWMFYVQHQFERTYWEHSEEWDYVLAAMHGSSYYKLPRILQWFTGNIGFHHIHHLSPRIPNYNLQRAHDENPLLQRATHLTIRDSLKTANLALWDEKSRRLVTFREVGQLQRQKMLAA
ncbi:fatty acid desaturase [Litorilinea aerophila]|uniref:Fatty acid desaturase n=1 Tax=Litorilinea aerophila TaxID=1204385 RepID=A0A540VBK8_9CHLR|nr:fatty acid desaturase [Litorilinea aerophila]MCC9078695.1 fatty acid desaturase [Litorilinea aerophila]